MTKYEFVDRFNANKVWILKVSKCHHYYVGQRVGKNCYPIQRVRKQFYMTIFEDSCKLISDEFLEGVETAEEDLLKYGASFVEDLIKGVQPACDYDRGYLEKAKGILAVI
ncbi:hypothetical protein AALB39_02080 [Lachnospiraceae bacterium 54-53]